MARIETRFGQVSPLGSTYTLVGAAVPASTTWNLLLNVTNRLTTTVKLRAAIADTTWASGLPADGTTLIAWIAYDLPIAPGSVVQISGNVLATTNKLVVWANTASSLDVIASGVSVT